MTIVAVDVLDIRFPTSRSLDGSDAMNPDPDYSAAYVILRTDAGDGLEGHGLTFTIGRGTEIVVAAIEALKGRILGRSETELFADTGALWRDLVGDSQLRWIGPEKGVIHLATAALVNAVWDLAAKRAGKPLWKLLADMTPDELVAAIDFRYISDALSPDQARDILVDRAATKSEREAIVVRDGYPAYTTSVGWLGYSDDKIRAPVRGGPGSGLDAVQDEGRSRPRRRRPPGRDRPGRDRARRQPDDGRQPALGRRRGDRLDGRRWPGSSRTGSRSRRAPTTSSATPGSREPSPRSGSRPASTSTTG